MELDYDDAKTAVLEHIQQLFHEIEEEAVVSHQEKYTLLEDSFENATDTDELKVAFEQWYHNHADDVDFEHEIEELWTNALLRLEEEEDDE